MKLFTLAALLISISITGCSYSIAEIDISNAEPGCVRDCSKTYSQCVSQGNQIGSKMETLRACREAYSICVQTCPPK